MTKPLHECRPEVHRKYLDVHFLIAGEERICVDFDDGENSVVESHRATVTLFFMLMNVLMIG